MLFKEQIKNKKTKYEDIPLYFGNFWRAFINIFTLNDNENNH